MTGPIGRITAWQIVPRRARPQDPQDAVQDGAWLGPRATAAVGTPPRTKDRFEDGPLPVHEIHVQGTTSPGES